MNDSETIDVTDSGPAESVGRRGITVLATPSRIDLKTIDDVRVEMARVYRDMRSGKIDTQDGTRLAYVLAQIGKLIEAGDIEKRLEALEGVLVARKAIK
jgi:hypothetical protein